MKRMKARYNGTCAGCGTPVNKGDTIRYAGHGLVYHDNCSPSGDSRADNEYWQGRAEGYLRSVERKIYGDAFVEQIDLARELRMMGEDY